MDSEPETRVLPSRRIRPVRAAVGAVMRVAPRLRPSLKQLLWRILYEVASARGKEMGTALMNYGYALPEDAALAQREPWAAAERFGLALYAAVAGPGQLAGKDVLEVGCGRGGGAAFVFERFGPRSMTGVDLARTAVRRCRRRYEAPGLTFLAGDAQSLPFPADAFDAVLNVESSHCYPDMTLFLGEVRRVLRPGGLLLLADFRSTASAVGSYGSADEVQALRCQLAEVGFRTVEEQEITAEVVRARALATPAVCAGVAQQVPRPLRRNTLEFSAVEGSAVFRRFSDGTLKYLRFVAEKQ